MIEQSDWKSAGRVSWELAWKNQLLRVASCGKLKNFIAKLKTQRILSKKYDCDIDAMAETPTFGD